MGYALSRPLQYGTRFFTSPLGDEGRAGRCGVGLTEVREGPVCEAAGPGACPSAATTMTGYVK